MSGVKGMSPEVLNPERVSLKIEMNVKMETDKLGDTNLF